MPPRTTSASFGLQLRVLRRRARLTQAELGIAVGYSDAQICRLETGRRSPDMPTLVALFFPALGLDPASPAAHTLLALAAAARAEHGFVEDANAAEAPTPPVAMPPVATPTLPQPATLLIGRSRERALLAEQLLSPAVRLLTLIGPPGVGKTHLALQIGHELASQFRDGARFVDLSATSDGALVGSAIAEAIGANESDQAALAAALGNQQLLLILDNFEQVREAAALLRALLAAAPALTLLVTSRVALRLAAEHTVVLSPLATPDLAHLPPLAELAQIDSLALLLARLRAGTPYLALTDKNALALAAICVRVDGLPLAIELVAARGNLFTPQELLSEVAQQLVALRRHKHDLPARQQSLSAALIWSYTQLAPHEQALFDRLSLFVGGWTIEAAVAVCDGESLGRVAILDGLETLLDHSLIQRQVEGETSRLTMLTLLRDYGQAQLELRGERGALQRRMFAYYAALAAEAERHLAYGSEQAAWGARLANEHDNLRAVLGWALHTQAQREGLQMAGALWRFWYLRGYAREGLRWLEAFLAMPTSQGTPNDAQANHQRAFALDGVGVLAWRQGNYAQAEASYHDALALYRSIGDQRGQAQVLSHMGIVLSEQGQTSRAMAHYHDSLQLNRALGNRMGVVSDLHNLGNLYCQQCDNERAMELFGECLEIYATLDDQSGIALVSLGMGTIERDWGHSAAAEALFLRSHTLAKQLGDSWTIATAQLNLGDLAADRGAYDEGRQQLAAARAQFELLGDQPQITAVQARQGGLELLAGDLRAAVVLFRQSLMLAHAIGFLSGVAEGLEGLAGCASSKEPLLAARLLAAAGKLRAQTGVPVATGDQPRYARTLQIARGNSQPGQWQHAWEAGTTLTLERAVALAMAGAR